MTRMKCDPKKLFLPQSNEVSLCNAVFVVAMWVWGGSQHHCCNLVPLHEIQQLWQPWLSVCWLAIKAITSNNVNSNILKSQHHPQLCKHQSNASMGGNNSLDLAGAHAMDDNVKVPSVEDDNLGLLPPKYTTCLVVHCHTIWPTTEGLSETIFCYLLAQALGLAIEFGSSMSSSSLAILEQLPALLLHLMTNTKLQIGGWLNKAGPAPIYQTLHVCCFVLISIWPIVIQAMLDCFSIIFSFLYFSFWFIWY